MKEWSSAPRIGEENAGAVFQFDGGWRMGIGVFNVWLNFGKKKKDEEEEESMSEWCKL